MRAKRPGAVTLGCVSLRDADDGLEGAGDVATTEVWTSSGEQYVCKIRYNAGGGYVLRENVGDVPYLANEGMDETLEGSTFSAGAWSISNVVSSSGEEETISTVVSESSWCRYVNEADPFH